MIGKVTHLKMQRAIINYTQNRVNSLIFWYAFFMAFPAIIIVQNISIYILPFLLLSLIKLSGMHIRIRYFTQVLALLFGVGALISSFNIPNEMPSGSFENALSVLPNYLYWVLLILLLTSYNRYIHLGVVFRGILFGLITSIFYYFFLQRIGLLAIPIFKLFTQNAFAFLLICYTPIVVWCLWRLYGNVTAIWAILILSLCGFLSGSRSGSILVLSGGLITLLINRRGIGRVASVLVLGYLVLIALSDSQLVRDLVKTLNPRTYEIVYNREKTLDSDRSILTRLAQIEKATLIFNKYPLSGIGLNNFTSYRINLPGNFEGSELVVNKKGIDEKSAHNSYFGFLAEGGLVLAVPFILLLVYSIFWFFRNINRIGLAYKPIFIGIIHMSIHLYFIYAILNVFAWFLIGLGCMVIAKHKK